MKEDVKKKPESYWKKKLTPEQFHVMRENGTEAPFTGKYYKNEDNGMYYCAACGAQLFSSENKFESTSPGLAGWPSFNEAVSGDAVTLNEDNSFWMKRTDVSCSKCGSHLGHLFTDVPEDKNKKHFCINSVSLDFKPKIKSK